MILAERDMAGHNFDNMTQIGLGLPDLNGAEDLVHCQKVELHDSGLLLAQIVLDTVQHTAADEQCTLMLPSQCTAARTLTDCCTFR